MENQTREEKLNAKFEAFKQETARIGRSYWASVRRGEARSREIRDSYTAVYQCPVCGFFRPADHSKKCRDIRAKDISMDEKIFRRDHRHDYNFDVEAPIEREITREIREIG